MTSRWAHNGGVALHYLDSDPDGGHPRAPVVFVPGFGEEALDHLGLVDELAPRRVVVPDLRGRGPSQVPDTGYALADHVADLDAVIDAAGLDRFHLASYSRGTAYALGWAVGNRDRLLSLCVAEYPPAQIIPPAGSDVALAAAMRFGRPLTERIRADIITRVLDEATDERFDDDLANIDAPLLVIRGTKRSSMVSEEVAAAYRAARPDVVFDVVEGSGHDLWKIDPHRVARRLRAFVDEVDDR